MKIPIAFVAGPFRAATPFAVAENVRRAERIGLQIAHLGAFPIMPQANSHLFLGQLSEEDFWLPGYQQLLDRCDCLVLVPGWRSSEGTKAEVARMMVRDRSAMVFDIDKPAELDRFKKWIKEFVNG